MVSLKVESFPRYLFIIYLIRRDDIKYKLERGMSTTTVSTVVLQLDHRKQQAQSIRKLLKLAMISEDYTPGTWTHMCTMESAIRDGGAAVFIQYPTGRRVTS